MSWKKHIRCFKPSGPPCKKSVIISCRFKQLINNQVFFSYTDIINKGDNIRGNKIPSERENEIMNAISQNLSNLKDFAGPSLGDGKFYAGRINQVTTSVENSKDITILTAEGDKVTISTDFQRTSQYTTYNGLARVNDLSLSLGGKNISIDSSSEFSMQVEGNLSEQEIKDIQKAMKAIDKILQSTFSGDLGKTAAMMNKIGNLESISSFEASMESKKSVVVEQAIMTVAEGTVESPVDGKADGSVVNQDSLKQAADQIMDIIKHSGVKPSKFIKPLNRYLSDYFLSEV